MKSLKTVLLGTTVALGLGFFGTSALADTLYTVKSGDTLSKISHNFAGDNSLINSIAQENNIADINLIHVGQELTINTDGSGVTYSVQPVQETTYQESTYQEPAYQAPAETTTSSSYTGNSSSAKEWIAQKESSGNYTATNGQYIGRYQLSSSYLNGDYSAENQERVADQYVAERYGSWEAAQQFWINNGWY